MRNFLFVLATLLALDPTATYAVCNDACQLGLLSEHNRVRARVNAGQMPAPSGFQPVASPSLANLTWSTSVASGAQAWSDMCKFEHSTGTGLGENLFASAGSVPTAADVVGSWESESSMFTYATIGDPVNNFNAVGHYTQLVWANTSQVGCGFTQCTTNSPFTGFPTWYYAVCRYSPAGNFTGQFPYMRATASPSRLANIATRGRVQTGANVLIAGFVIGGTTPKKVLITARGPSVAVLPSEVSLLMADPSMVLYAGANPIDSNDDWQTRVNFNDIPATMRPGSNKDAAILTTLNPGAYTAIVSGVGNATGLTIVEVFEVENPNVPLINIATRGKVEPGANVMIAGFIIQGSAPQKVLVTARGQSVAVLPSEVPLLMADPKMTLYSGATPIASNDDWQTLIAPPGGSPVTLLAPSGIPSTQVPGNVKDAAILTTLAPGAYTAIVEGVGSTSGIAIVEVFAQ